MEEEVNVHRSETEKNAFKVETTRILLNFDPFHSGKRPLSLVFNAESSYIFLYCFYFVINYKKVHTLRNS